MNAAPQQYSKTSLIMWAMTASTPGTLTERWLQSVRKWITEGAVSLRVGVWPGCNSKFSVRLVFTSLIGARWGAIFMRVRKYWLDYDLAAVALLLIGLAAVEVLALVLI
jgi:hypothetical protein